MFSKSFHHVVQEGVFLILSVGICAGTNQLGVTRVAARSWAKPLRFFPRGFSDQIIGVFL